MKKLKLILFLPILSYGCQPPEPSCPHEDHAWAESAVEQIELAKKNHQTPDKQLVLDLMFCEDTCPVVESAAADAAMLLSDILARQ